MKIIYANRGYRNEYEIRKLIKQKLRRKLGQKKLKPAWEVVLITAKIACIFTGVNFIK